MGPSRTSNSHDGDGRRGKPEAHEWVGRPLLLAGLLVGLGLLWSRFTGGQGRSVPSPETLSTPPGPRRAHEKRDVSVGWIFAVVLFLGISGIAMHFILAGFLSHLNKTPSQTDAWQPSTAQVGQPSQQPGFPVLQISPPLDLQKLRIQEEQELNSYGWVNQSSGVVHIPIRVAMDLLLKKGLPARESPGKAQTRPSSLDLMHERVQSETLDTGKRK